LKFPDGTLNDVKSNWPLEPLISAKRSSGYMATPTLGLLPHPKKDNFFLTGLVVK
jgi:hypothetical protein